MNLTLMILGKSIVFIIISVTCAYSFKITCSIFVYITYCTASLSLHSLYDGLVLDPVALTLPLKAI